MTHYNCHSSKSKILARFSFFLCLGITLLIAIHSTRKTVMIGSFSHINSNNSFSEKKCFEHWSPNRIFKENRIFFHETSGSNFLYQRQLCTVESAAFHNPDKSIQVFIHSSNEPNCRSPWAAVLNKYSNVEIILVNNSHFFADSPFENVHESSYWRHDTNAVYELSEHARIVTLTRGYGIYMDLDFVVLRKIEENIGDFLVFRDAKASTVTGAIFQLSKKSKLLSDIVGIMKDSLDPSSKESSLTVAMKRALANSCRFNSSTDLLPPGSRCQNVSLLPYTAFLPFTSEGMPYVIGVMTDTGPLEKTKNFSKAVHYWDKETSWLPILYHLKLPASILAKENCPETYTMSFRLLL